MGTFAIRKAEFAEAGAIAEIHVRGWRWAYRGLLPESLLGSLSVERREAMWARAIRDGPPGHGVWVAESDGRVVGFVATGDSEDPGAPGGTAQVFAIYLEPEVAGTGVGRSLFETAVADLRARGYAAATLWVLESNDRARRFYEAAGWRTDGQTQTERIDDVELREVRYRIDLTATGSPPAS